MEGFQSPICLFFLVCSVVENKIKIIPRMFLTKNASMLLVLSNNHVLVFNLAV